MEEILGEVCGVVLTHPDKKSIHLAGDTICNEDVAAILSDHAPEAVSLNAG